MEQNNMQLSYSPHPADSFFDPITSFPYTSLFDGTLLFEQSILGLCPAVVFPLLTPFRVKALLKIDIKTDVT